MNKGHLIIIAAGVISAAGIVITLILTAPEPAPAPRVTPDYSEQVDAEDRTSNTDGIMTRVEITK